MVTYRNGNGYDISSQNYFSELSSHLGRQIIPATRQSVCDSRMKLSYKAFEYLFKQANQEGVFREAKWKGHIVRAIDGTDLRLPFSKDIVKRFPRRTQGDALKRAGKKLTIHYPSALFLTAINLITGQPTAVRIDHYRAGERNLLLSLIKEFAPSDISVLDMGFEGFKVMVAFEALKQYFVLRVRGHGKHMPLYLRSFLKSGQKSAIVKIPAISDDGKPCHLTIRLIQDLKQKGKPLIIATNLLDEKKYPASGVIKLYRKRWNSETTYNRVKNLLLLQKFHAKTVNGILQEIYANLLVISLTAIICYVTKIGRRIPQHVVPSFKNATEVLRRNLFQLIDQKITRQQSNQLAARLIKDVARVLWKEQPGRSYPRVSMQPINTWALNKEKKILEYQDYLKTLVN